MADINKDDSTSKTKKLFEKDQKALLKTIKNLGEKATDAIDHFRKAEQRSSEVKYLLLNKKLKTADDYYNISYILLHNEHSLEDIALGALTALTAMELGHEKANKIYASCVDRFLMALDLDVKYSRYNSKNNDGSKVVHDLKNQAHLAKVNKARKELGLPEIDNGDVVFSEK